MVTGRQELDRVAEGPEVAVQLEHDLGPERVCLEVFDGAPEHLTSVLCLLQSGIQLVETRDMPRGESGRLGQLRLCQGLLPQNPLPLVDTLLCRCVAHCPTR